MSSSNTQPRYEDQDEDDDVDFGPDEKSKSQVKREWRALLPIARDLVDLADRQFRAMPLSEALLDAIVLARKLKRGALQRQLRYSVGVLAREDHVAIESAIAALRRPQAAEVAAMHEVEGWRDQLIAGDDAMLTALLTRFPALDRQHLMQLVRGTQRERVNNQPPKAARQLFKYLASLRAGTIA